MTFDSGSRPAPGPTACTHVPACPAADSADRYAARVMMRFDAQDWAMLCNGILVFGPEPGLPVAPPVLYSVPTPAAPRKRKAGTTPADDSARTLRAG